MVFVIGSAFGLTLLYMSEDIEQGLAACAWVAFVSLACQMVVNAVVG